MPLFKEQRFHHSEEVKCHMRKQGRGGTEYRDGVRSGTYYDINEDEHLHVQDGPIGPARNMFIVSALSVAGLLIWFVVWPMMAGG